MEFNLDYVMEISNSDLLNIVNDYQCDYELEEFDSIEEIPYELIMSVLDWCDYFNEEISYLSIADYTVTKIDEEN